MKICLITNTLVSYNPRLLKEADTLHENGHDVRVISVSNNSERAEADEKLALSRTWKWEKLDFLPEKLFGRLRWLISGIRVKLFLQLSKLSLSFNNAELAFCRYLPETLITVLKEPADLYIAHNLQSLPVAAKAAKATNGLLGFDVEDFHIGEDSSITFNPHEQKLKEYIIGKYIIDCDYLSTTSEAMAQALIQEFNIPYPTVLYNVFPLAYSTGLLPPKSRTIASTSREYYTAYWFSQFIHLDRGIQDFIRAMPLLSKRVELHLRGMLIPDVRDAILDLARQLGVEDTIFFHPLIYAEDLVGDAAQYDFGLALEQPVSKNRLITVTNKLFVYLLAGNAIIATKTPGQQEILEKLPGVGIQYDFGDFADLARQINNHFLTGDILNMRQKSWEAGQSKYNWDREQKNLLDTVNAFTVENVI